MLSEKELKSVVHSILHDQSQQQTHRTLSIAQMCAVLHDVTVPLSALETRMTDTAFLIDSPRNKSVNSDAEAKGVTQKNHSATHFSPSSSSSSFHVSSPRSSSPLVLAPAPPLSPPSAALSPTSSAKRLLQTSLLRPLPAEIWSLIFSWLDLSSHLTCMRVSRAWLRAAVLPESWTAICCHFQRAVSPSESIFPLWSRLSLFDSLDFALSEPHWLALYILHTSHFASHLESGHLVFFWSFSFSCCF